MPPGRKSKKSNLKNQATAYNIKGNILVEQSHQTSNKVRKVRIKQALSAYDKGLQISSSVDPVGYSDIVCNKARCLLLQGTKGGPAKVSVKKSQLLEAEDNFRYYFQIRPKNEPLDRWFADWELSPERAVWAHFPPKDGSLPDYR